ncbi:MAG: purine-nucleoside phosphorylase, partial [Balneolaceae bacterium]
AGAINTSFNVGDLMVIDDIFRPPRMITPTGGDRFRYKHYPYADRVRTIGANLGLSLQRGTYMYVQGPTYETKAEIRAFRIMGADAVGMSTAPELTEASRLGLPAAGVSLITNMSTGITSKKLDHAEVEKAAESRKGDFAKLVKALIADW